MSESQQPSTGRDVPDLSETVVDGSAQLAQVAPVQEGRYLVYGEVARGGMGAILRGHDPVLHRDLAIKVLRDDSAQSPAARQRFREEAQIGGQLQHPGVVPVYELGAFPDGRSYFTMKFVEGVTFAKLLRERSSLEQERSRCLKIFEQVCQTLAYAHARGVLHRDVKPHNVMVGAFGEVQLMDWGLARLANVAEKQTAVGALPAVDLGRAGSSVGETRHGDVLGTPAYMAPEQAQGDLARLGPAADVFSLGAILCEVLTGKPPYSGADASAVLEQARRGDLAEARERLSACGADAELIALAQRCLEVDSAARPANARQVAAAVETYLARVEERARQAELERTAAEARVTEARMTAAAERRARRLTLGLAGAVLLLVLGGGAVAWVQQRRHEEQLARRRETADKVHAALERGRELLAQGWRDHDAFQLKAAQVEAVRALEIAGGEASPEVRQLAAAFDAELRQRLEQYEKNRVLLAALLDVSEPRETGNPSEDGTRLSRQRSADEQYALAFRRWGLDLDNSPENARLREQPTAVVQEIIAGLDGWLVERLHKKTQRPWQPLQRLADALDRSEPRRRLRALLTGATSAPEQIADALLPSSAWWELLRGPRWRRQLELPGKLDPATEPVLSVVLWARTCAGLGLPGEAERVLRLALATRPDQVVLLDALGKLMEQQGRYRESIEYFRAIRAARPGLGIALGQVLLRQRRFSESEAVLRDLCARRPDSAETLFHLGNTLRVQRKFDEAVSSYRRALQLEPKYVDALCNLGITLGLQAQHAESAAMFRTAIALRPDDADLHNNLGIALRDQKQPLEAVAALRQAVQLKPELPEPHSNLGLALKDLGDVAASEAALRKALALSPRSSVTVYNLGLTLKAAGKLPEAEAAFRRVLELRPDDTEARNDLAIVLNALRRTDEAIAVYRQAIELRPDFAKAYNNLGNALRDRQRLDEASVVLRKAIELQPDFAEAHNNLGNVFRSQQKNDEAAVAYRRAISLKPSMAEPHFNLAMILYERKELSEALLEFRRAEGLLPGHPLIRDMRQKTERLAQRDAELPAILSGKERPRDPRHAVEMAEISAYREHYRTATRLYADAFKGDARLADNLALEHRSRAARAALLSAAGKGKDASGLEPKERGRLRTLARDWLTADLKAYREVADRNKAERRIIRERLRGWFNEDTGFVRSEKALAELEQAERDSWQQLWREVRELLQRLDGDK